MQTSFMTLPPLNLSFHTKSMFRVCAVAVLFYATSKMQTRFKKSVEMTPIGRMIADLDTPDEGNAISAYRECALKFTHIMSLAVAFITESGSPHVATWAVAFATGNPVCAGMSITDKASELGVSPQALSKQIRRFITQTGLSDSTGYLYSKQS